MCVEFVVGASNQFCSLMSLLNSVVRNRNLQQYKDIRMQFAIQRVAEDCNSYLHQRRLIVRIHMSLH